MIRLKKILVPVDFSDVSKLALHYAASFCSEYGAELHLLHVVEEEVLHPGHLDDTLNVAKIWKDESLKKLDAFLDRTMRNFEVRPHVRGGLVFEGILACAAEQEIDLIVMGSHGVTGYVSAWLGGTAYEVARKSTCPVLTVKPSERPFAQP